MADGEGRVGILRPSLTDNPPRSRRGWSFGCFFALAENAAARIGEGDAVLAQSCPAAAVQRGDNEGVLSYPV